MSDRPIIDWAAWTDSPPGRYILEWEQAQLDHTVSDIFGYHAVQLGMPQLDALRENRMPCRGLALDFASAASAPYSLPPGAALPPSDDTPHNNTPPTPAPPSVSSTQHAPAGRSTLWCDFVELPLETQSVDLLVLPHTLEFTRDPHGLLREAERVLVPEGRMVILGFNSLSLWGVRQSVGRMSGKPFAPSSQDLIAFTRLKDWIKLLGFELSRGRFGCYRPPLATDKWLDRYAFMEPAGDRWWPIFGAAYLVTAIKRVRGMRLVGPMRLKKVVPTPVIVPVPAPQSCVPAAPSDTPAPPLAA